MDPITIGLAIAGAGAFGGLSYAQAQEQNEATGRAMRSQRNAAETQDRQVDEAAEVERAKNANRAHQIRGRLRVLSAEAGIGMAAYEQLERQADYDEAINDHLIRRNRVSQQERIRSGLAANITALESSITNPLLAALSGSLGGLTTGLSIGGAVQGMNSAAALNTTPQSTAAASGFAPIGQASIIP